MAVLVPWVPGDAHREAAWSLLKQRHLDHGRTVVEGTTDGPWCKAAAVADALSQTSEDLLIVHDADVWCDGLDQAVTHVVGGAPWAIPHRQVWRLARDQMRESLDRNQLAQPPYVGWAGGGIVVIRRDVYEDCPIDPRFVGWGSEDASWAMALTTLYGPPWRGQEPLWHWWHPPQPRMNRVIGSRESEALWRRYQRAAKNPARMRHIIEEAKECPTSRSTPTLTS